MDILIWINWSANVCPRKWDQFVKLSGKKLLSVLALDFSIFVLVAALRVMLYVLHVAHPFKVNIV